VTREGGVERRGRGRRSVLRCHGKKAVRKSRIRRKGTGRGKKNDLNEGIGELAEGWLKERKGGRRRAKESSKSRKQDGKDQGASRLPRSRGRKR